MDIPLARRSRLLTIEFSMLVCFLVIAGGERFRLGGAVGTARWADAGWTTAALVAVIACGRAASRVSGRARRAWLCFTAGCTVWLIGQLFWNYYDLRGSFPPSPTVCDIGYLGLAPFFIAGMLTIGTRGRLSWVLLVLDICAVGLAFGILIQNFFWTDFQASSLSFAGKYTALAYPTVYITMAGAMVLIPLRAAWRNLSIRFLFLGLLGQAIPFFLWTPLVLAGTFHAGGLLDLIWMASLLFIALSALTFGRLPVVDAETQLFGAVSYIPLAVTLAACALRLWDGSRSDMSMRAENYLTWLMVGLVAVTVVRLWLTRWRSSQLYDLAQEAIAEARRSEQRFRAIFDAAPIGIELADRQGRLTATNAAFQEMLGYSGEELLNLSFGEITHPDDVAAEDALDEELIAGQRKTYQLEKRHVRKDGTPLWTRLTAAVVRDDDGNSLFAVGMVEDISERRTAQDELLYQAMHDSLTALPNRALLRDRLKQALLSATRESRSCALLLMDLDRFKEINDTFGHHFGDAVLQHVASRLSSVLRTTDTVARLGGDEFAVVLSMTDEDQAILVAEKLTVALAEPVQVFDHDLQIESSIGIALYPQHGADATALLREADVAMYAAKRDGKPYVVYIPDHDRNAERRMLLAGALPGAIARGEFFLHFQPIVDVDTGLPAAVETLVRWNHPSHGTIPPDEFISLAEQTGVILSLTSWVVDAALEAAAGWIAQGMFVPVAVNLSARSLHDRDLPATIAQLLEKWTLPATVLHLELTESAVMADADRALEVLRSLAAMGLAVAIDDFGTGYSSLSYLRLLPVALIKIDRTFVTEIHDSAGALSIIRATVSLAHELDLRVVAEGVEDESAIDELRRVGCDLLQGYHICRPLPGDNISNWLSTRMAVASGASTQTVT